MYLAEDHILCFEIVTKKEGDWILKYAKSVKATTDVCTADLDVWAQAQSQVFLQEASSATSGTDSAFNFLSQGASHDVFEIFLRLYIALLFVVIVCSLGNRPRGYKWIYVIRKILLGICNVIMLWCAGWTVYFDVPHTLAGWKDFSQIIVTNEDFRNIVISLAVTFGLYLFSSFMHLEPWHMFTSFIQYMFLLPSYVNILSKGIFHCVRIRYQIFVDSDCLAFNLTIISRGTKGDNGAAKDLGEAKKLNSENGKEITVEVKLPPAGENVDHMWKDSLSTLNLKASEEKAPQDHTASKLTMTFGEHTFYIIYRLNFQSLLELPVHCTSIVYANGPNVKDPLRAVVTLKISTNLKESNFHDLCACALVPDSD
ncbi:hypothetical protein EDB19DRAFT_1833214 [Suillus lakei]|nr:hypothetical protein EDB19DRAFT_1833214 [Suillus lakei]